MIDLIIAYLAVVVVLLFVIIVFLTFYIIYERRKRRMITEPFEQDKRMIVPLLTLKTTDRSSGDHSNSAVLTATHKRMTKRLRHRPRTLFIRTQNSQGFLLSSSSPKLIQQTTTTNSTIDQTTLHFDY